MTEPALGFVASEKEGTATHSRKPHLNANEEYTYVVDETVPTEVVQGGIQCALDGGTVEIGLYDITDGVEGAPLVFSQDGALPERPLDGGDGYEVDTHVFDLDPVPLHNYVERELAVAARHESSRTWGNNWYDPEANYYRAAEGPLSTSWSGDLKDGYAPRSMGLFVEPVETPEGKDRVVLRGEFPEDRSQTVFTGFSGLSPETGMVVEYDEQTGADAPVTVFEDGTLDVGQGADATDSIEVRIRDTDGTWQGPRDVTLDGKLGSVELSATGDTISADGSTATLSLKAAAVDRLTVEKLWTDWTVDIADADGASTDTSVAGQGELKFEWGAVQSVVRPSVNITPPAGTYNGNGFYVVEVVAEGAGNLVTDTARFEIGGERRFSAEDGISSEGAFSDGNRIVLQDEQARFGTKSTQAPHMFDRQADGQLVNGSEMDAYTDVEEGAHVPVGVDDGYVFDEKDGNPRLGDPRGESPPSPGRSKWYYAKPHENGGGDDYLTDVAGWPDHEDEDPPKPRRQVYITWLMRTNWNLDTGDPFDIEDPGGAAKVHRVGADIDRDALGQSWSRYGSGLRVGPDKEYKQRLDPPESEPGIIWNDFGRWHRMEMEIDYRDGGFDRCYVDGELLHDQTILDTWSEWSGSISPELWGYNPSEPTLDNPAMVFELADYYVDSSLARVVLTNAKVWDQSDRRVTQPHFSWEGDQLEIELYEGVLADEDIVYLWVVDENGDPTRVGTLSRKSGADSSLDEGNKR